LKEHRYIKRTHKYYTRIILIIVICTFLFLSKKIGYHKTSYKLHIRETRSGRPVIYLLDEISGSVEIINPNNVEYIKELKNKYDVVVKE
jgi:DNA transposition AAA+ family ATPase